MTEGRFSCGTSSSCSCSHRRGVAFGLIALHHSVEDHSEWWWNSIVGVVVSHLVLLLVVYFLQPCSDTNCRIEEASCSTRGGVNSAFFKFFKNRETIEEFSCKTPINHRDKSQQHTRDLYWFGQLTYSSPQATPIENALKTLVKHLTRNNASWHT